jgi:hypothetical protein
LFRLAELHGAELNVLQQIRQVPIEWTLPSSRPGCGSPRGRAISRRICLSRGAMRCAF